MPSCDVVPDSTDLGTDRPNLRPITDIDDRFEPIQIPSNVSWINIPPDISPLDAANLWGLYFSSEMLQTIAKHINIYVNESHRWGKERGSKARSFSDTDKLELKTYFEIRIYMNLHKEPQVSDYWNIKLNKPLHSLIREAMTLNRYENIDRNLYFFDYKSKFRSDNAVFQRVSVFLI